MWERPAVPPSPLWRRLDHVLREAETTRRVVAAGVSTDWDGVELRVLGPPRPRGRPRRVSNDDSIVVVARLGDVSFLLAGDVEKEAERRLAVPPALVLKVPHHASRSSSGAALLSRVRPRLAVASLGARNPFGYPHPEVVDRYREAGALFLRTDRDGPVRVSTDGSRLWVRTAGEALERRIH